MIRAFISIELDPDLRGRLAKLQQDIKSELQRTLPRNARLQWVKPESLHVSVKFLGDVEEARLDAIREALSARSVRAVDRIPDAMAAAVSALTAPYRRRTDAETPIISSFAVLL